MTSKTKNRLLIVGFVLMLCMSYQLSISKTIAAKQRYETLSQDALLFNNAPKQISMLRQKEKHFDSILGKYQLNGLSLQNNLLKTIADLAKKHRLKVISFNEPHKTENDEMSTNHYQFGLQGDFNGILQLVYVLEQETRFGEVVHLNFERKKNYRTNRYYLEAQVLLKSYSG
ncbi:MAG: hypothetical protein HRU49_09730 [Winogradskyella sp.]|uniref:hypothetical protein n=1 Tax=Winogradskyella sp. TaxID=1883156 RepID=UPI0025E12E5A|nr:hypothetical protein [Winogradskyella sp.]NRB84035.1 hypothetical protein [Winogradskyella sp.]